MKAARSPYSNKTSFYFQLEEIYKKAHANIRSDPSHKKVEKKAGIVKKRLNAKKLTLEQRKQRVADRKAAFLAKLQTESEA